jgi:cellulose synthase operon protein C
MRTVRQTRMVLPGTRARVYEIDLVDTGSAREARFLVNFRYGWQGAVLEEGTRTPDAVPQEEALRIFDSLIVARKNQGYHLPDETSSTPKIPALVVVADSVSPRENVLAARLRGFDSLPDIKAASLLRRLGELRMKSLCAAIAAAARNVMREGNRRVTLRTLPYALHRTDDGSGLAASLLQQLSTCADAPMAETAAMLHALREPQAASSWDTAPLVLKSAATLSDPAAREAAVLVYFQAAVAAPAQPTGFARLEGVASGDASKDAVNRMETAQIAETALRDLYVRGAHDATARSMLLAVLAAVPLRPPLFRAIRRVWQVAETTDDAEVFSRLLARFDNERSTVPLVRWAQNGVRQVIVGGRYVALREEAAKPNTSIAYSDPTRNYLRRRGWRTLRRLGEAGDPAYVAMAEAVLLSLEDGAEKDVPARKTFHYDPQARQQRVIELRYPKFPDRYAAHHIMHGAHNRLIASPVTLRWQFNLASSESASRREERFPELWAAHPETLWRLARNARAELVVGFAARALIENTAFLDTIPTSDIAGMIVNWSPLNERLQLAITLAERRISNEGLKPELGAALISDPGRGGALVKFYLGGRPELLPNAPDLFAAMLVGCAAGNHAWFDALAQQAVNAATAPVRADVLARAFAAIEAANWLTDDFPRAKLLATLLTRLFPAELTATDGETIRCLYNRDNDVVRLIAALLASARPDGASLVDVGQLAQSANPDLRAAGISLFAKRPLDVLIADLDAIAAFLTANSKEPREAARSIAGRIGHERREAARLLAEKLLPAIYRAEDHEGLREDVYAVLSEELRGGVVALGPETIWTLLKARSELARRLGAEVLDGFKPTDFSIRQLARIGCNDQVKARRWALIQLQARVEEVRARPEEGFALLDCAFEDAREAGYTLYRNELHPEEWTASALVALSDSITEPAQRFGREMIGKVFEAKNADFLLSRLAEHPAPGFRLLVARLMRDFVKDDTQRLRQLVPAIETTLLQVRKSRAAKDQVFAFIEEQLGAEAEGMGGERTAILAPILERSVATCATADRARALLLLASIKHKNPELAPRVAIVPREVRS